MARASATDHPTDRPSTGAGTRAASRDFTRVGRSRIEGRGVFARRRIPRGTRIFEYLGKRRTIESVVLDAAEATSRTYLFRLNDQIVIDATAGGSDARFVNHGCEPNCEAYVFDDRLYIYAMRDIARGEELTIDYQLNAPLGAIRGKARDIYACRCGAPTCRGSMLASKRRRAARPATDS